MHFASLFDNNLHVSRVFTSIRYKFAVNETRGQSMATNIVACCLYIRASPMGLTSQFTSCIQLNSILQT